MASRERVIKQKRGLAKGQLDLLVQIDPGPPPTPEKFQRKARLRRLRQQRDRAEITWAEHVEAIQRVENDYKPRR